MNLVRSLHHRNFRLFFAGQVFSMIGIWMQATAVGWLVWRLTHSPKWLGAVGFSTQIPILIFGLFAGVVADRVRRHRLVIWIQMIAMFQASLLAIFTLTEKIDPIMIIILSLFSGVISAFDLPSRQSFLMDMVGPEDIGNAVAMNSSIVHASRMVGPVIAGLLIAQYGEGVCFTVNTLSFLFVLAALLLMRKDDFYHQPVHSQTSVKSSIKDALQYIWTTNETRKPVIFLCILSLSAMPYIVFLPQIVSERFHGTARELGIAMSAAGVGALVGAVTLAMRKGIIGLQNTVKLSLGLAGLSLIALSLAPTLGVAIPILTLMGLVSFLVVAGTNTVLQVTALPHFRGRVMSVFTVSFFGLIPIGSLIAGFTAAQIGIYWTIAIFGSICVIASIQKLR